MVLVGNETYAELKFGVWIFIPSTTPGGVIMGVMLMVYGAKIQGVYSFKNPHRTVIIHSVHQLSVQEHRYKYSIKCYAFIQQGQLVITFKNKRIILINSNIDPSNHHTKYLMLMQLTTRY
mgnify:CR=1 FL=1